MAEKVKSQMKEKFYAIGDRRLILPCFATCKLVCDTNSIQEGAAVLVFPFSVKDALTTTSNGRMLAATHIAPVALLESTVETTTERNLPRLYPEVVNSVLKFFASSQAKTGVDSATLRT